MSPFPGAAYDHDNEPYWRRFNHELASATNPLRAGISSVAASVDQLAASKGSLDPNGFFYLTSLVMSIPVDSKAQQMFEVVQDAARTKNIELTLPSMFQRLDSNREGKAIYAFTIPSEIHGVLLSLKNLIWELSDNVMTIRPNYTPRGRENQGFVSKGSEKLMEMGYTPAVRDGVLCVALPDGEVCPVAQYADLSQLVAAGEFGPRPLFTKHVARFSQQQGGSTAAMGSNPRAQPPPPPLSQQQRWWQQQQQQQQQPQQQQWRQQPEQQRQQPPPQQHYIFRQQQQQQQQRAPPPPPPGYPSQPHNSSQMPPAQQPRFTSRYQSAVDQRQQQQQPHQHKGTHDFEMSAAGYNSAFPPLVSSSAYQSYPPNPLYGPPPAPNQQQQQQQQHPYPGRVTSTTADEDGLHSRRNMPPPGYYGAYGPPSRAPASGLPDQSRGGSAADPRSQQQQQQQQQHTQVVQNQQQPPPQQPRQQQQQQPQPSHPSGSLPPSSTQQMAAPIALNGVPAVAGGGGGPSSMSEPATPAHALIQSNFSELTATANSSAHGPAPMSLGTVHAGRTQGLFGSPATTPDSLQLRISDPGAAQHSNGEHSGETEQGGQ